MYSIPTQGSRGTGEIYHIMVGIDGTGSKDWKRKDGSNSWVYRFCTECTNLGVKRYFEGPGMEGLDCQSIAFEVLTYISSEISNYFRNNDHYKKNINLNLQALKSPTIPQNFLRKGSGFDMFRIVLIGHSRGGAIATYVAKLLPYPVYFLGLFDSVNMSVMLPNTDAIQNTEYAFHALRGLKRSRALVFPNTSRTSSSGYYEEQKFITTHGGTGGDPFPDGFLGKDYLAHKWLLFKKTEDDIESESRQANEWMRYKASMLGIRFR